MKKPILIFSVCLFFFGVFFHIAFNSPETSNVNRFIASSDEIPDEIIENALSMTVTISLIMEEQYKITCHGILISPDEVLTAGHCINNIFVRMLVRKNTANPIVVTIYHKSTEEQMEVTHHIAKRGRLHPDFSRFKVPMVEQPFTPANDIGIIKLGEKISFEHHPFGEMGEEIRATTKQTQETPAKFVDMHHYIEDHIPYEKCFMTDWRTALARRKGEMDFNDMFVNSVNYNSPVEDSDPVFLISRLRQAGDFLRHGLAA
ncbi:MAG: trypsin-like serine protease, partial [Halobacteriovoraceae bacterium]|nr:trypsin-like serine protease [Halobacteriovoraceae bacterium]